MCGQGVEEGRIERDVLERGIIWHFEKLDFTSIKKGEVRRGGKGEEASSASHTL